MLMYVLTDFVIYKSKFANLKRKKERKKNSVEPILRKIFVLEKCSELSIYSPLPMKIPLGLLLVNINL